MQANRILDINTRSVDPISPEVREAVLRAMEEYSKQEMRKALQEMRKALQEVLTKLVKLEVIIKKLNNKNG